MCPHVPDSFAHGITAAPLERAQTDLLPESGFFDTTPGKALSPHPVSFYKTVRDENSFSFSGVCLTSTSAFFYFSTYGITVAPFGTM
jgi:hypothetical protein